MANQCDDRCDTNDCNKNDNQNPQLYPVVIESPGSILSLDTESINSENEEWNKELALQNNAVIPQTSTINIENSSDVVIGPLTQFHGPVTIYQNINSDNQNSQPNLGVECKSDIILNSSAKLVSPGGNVVEKNPPSPKLLFKSNRHLAIFAVLILAMLTTVIVSLVLNENSKHTDYTSHNSNENKTEDPPLGTHKIYSKTAWGGRESLSIIEPLFHPTEYVVISHTVGRVCKNFQECSKVMNSIQTNHVSQRKEPDIGYNFVIGGDGNIYVGRGWDVVNSHKNNTICISFTGNFIHNYLTPDMISALEELLALGVRLNKLSPDYKIVCQNQTSSTLSPGNHVYDVISELPHFHAGPVNL